MGIFKGFFAAIKIPINLFFLVLRVRKVGDCWFVYLWLVMFDWKCETRFCFEWVFEILCLYSLKIRMTSIFSFNFLFVMKSLLNFLIFFQQFQLNYPFLNLWTQQKKSSFDGKLDFLERLVKIPSIFCILCIIKENLHLIKFSSLYLQYPFLKNLRLKF